MYRSAPPEPRRAWCVRLSCGVAVAAALAITTVSAQIPGRNVNMVAGNTWPDGDPFLQRQNEPSIAASCVSPSLVGLPRTQAWFAFCLEAVAPPAHRRGADLK